jgi:hypothetical protein
MRLWHRARRKEENIIFVTADKYEVHGARVIEGTI